MKKLLLAAFALVGFGGAAAQAEPVMVYRHTPEVVVRSVYVVAPVPYGVGYQASVDARLVYLRHVAWERLHGWHEHYGDRY